MAAPSVAIPPVLRSPGTVRIMMTGDVMLGRGVDQILPHHCPPVIYESYIKDARGYVKLAVEAIEAMSPDLRLINLETAMTTHDKPWPHKGINYRCHPGNVGVLNAASIQVASLANNHVMDWGLPGLIESLETLEVAGIQVIGAGRNASQAERPAAVIAASTADGRPAGHSGTKEAYAKDVRSAADLARADAPAGADAGGGRLPDAKGCAAASGGAGRILVWAVCHESSGVPEAWEAAGGSPGVCMTDMSPRDVGRIAARVAAEKRPGRDVAVVSIHTGSNWGFDVPEEQQRFARALIRDAGVDVIHGHSSHHAKGAEVFMGKLILWGAGDLISDYEGIKNSSVESRYPHEEHRDDVGVIWFADVCTRDGRLQGLSMMPTRLRHLRLERPDPGDWRYIEATMDREFRRLGAKGGVMRVPAPELAAAGPGGSDGGGGGDVGGERGEGSELLVMNL